MAYFVVLVSAFLALSAATALRPGGRGLFAALAHPVGWAAGELAGQSLAIEGGLVILLLWWGWPRTHWLGLLVVIFAVLTGLEDAALVFILFVARRVVGRAMLAGPDVPIDLSDYRRDHYGRWWRTALQIPVHPRSMQLHANLVYGPERRHLLDVWCRAEPVEGAPVILYFHGGAWSFGTKREQGRPMLHEFVSRGWIVVTCNYRLAPRHPWPAQIEDASRVLAWVKRRAVDFGGDPDRIVVAGGSAGAHLAALLALTADDPTWRPRDSEVTDWSVRGAISFYGVLETTGDEAHWRGLGRALRKLLEYRVVQEPFVDHEAIYRAMSPYDRVSAGAPPFLVVQGSNDTLVDVHVARDFVARFRDVALAPIYYVELPFTQHAYDLTASPRTSATTRAAVAFAERVSTPRPTLSGALVASYQVPPTVLRVLVNGAWLDATAAARQVGSFVIVTADNPYSRALEASDNQRRREALTALLGERGEPWFETSAASNDERWPDEVGVALLRWSREDVAALARRFEQFAYYDVDERSVVVRDARTHEVRA